MTGADDDIEPLGQLSPEPWMTAPETRAVLDALTADGVPARFVGGCVRDALAHRPVKDVDIATPLPPETVIERIEAAGLKAVPTGIEHGTVTAVSGGKPFEITTLRRDVACDGRHAEVAFTDDWRADAARRDLTINAMSATPDGRVYDYFEGIEHLSKGIIRFIGQPKMRIEEDYLRILRYFRFFAHYGRAGPNIEALAAIRVAAPKLSEISGERIREEMLKIFAADNAADVLLRMQGIGVLDTVLPEAREFGTLRILCWLVTRGIRIERLEPEPLRRLASALPGFGSEEGRAAALAVARRWRLSNKDRDRLVAAVAPAVVPTPEMDTPALRAALYRQGRQAYRDAALIAWASYKALIGKTRSEETEHWRAVVELPDAWSPPDFPVRGRDLVAAGLEPGPAVGAAMRALETWWIDQDFAPDKAALLARLEALE